MENVECVHDVEWMGDRRGLYKRLSHRSRAEIHMAFTKARNESKQDRPPHSCESEPKGVLG